MKKLLVIFLLIIPFLFPFKHIAAQVDEVRVIPGKIAPPATEFPNLLGQNHNYSVTLRGNGEAVVLFKAAFYNSTDKPLSELFFRVPRVNPQDITVFQVIREPSCVRYPQPGIMEGQGSSQSLIYPMPPPQACEEYQEPDYFGYWYGEAKYQKAVSELRGDTFAVILPKPVNVDASGSIIAYYRGFGYAKKDVFGRFNFTFETLKTNDRIRNLQVGIITDSDLVLAGAKGTVNYRFDESVMSLKSAGVTAEVVRSPQFDSVVQQIGYGAITKTASNLMPLESYTVKGAYASSSLKLYAKGLLIGLVSFAIFVIVVIFIIKKLVRAYEKRPITSEKIRSAAAKSNPALDIFSVLGLSFVSSVLVAVVTAGVMMLSRLIIPSLPAEATVVLTVLIIIVMALLYVLLFVGPAIFLGIKRGLWWGVGTCAATIGWFILYIFILFIVYLGISRNPTEPYPLPLMRSMMGIPEDQGKQSQPASGIPID